MITHERARDLASAAHDGELEPSLRPELDAHLAECPTCPVFATGLPLLSAAVAAAPREAAPRALPQRVRRALRPSRVRRWSWSLAPLTAAAAVVALVVITSGAAPGPFPLPEAGAATPLLTLESVFIEREVRTERVLVDSRTEVETTRERMWYAAPGRFRLESVTTGPGGTETETVIELPGVRYSTREGLARGVAPAILLPEPLSPTLAELGRDVGPGPSVAGRATRRIELEVAGETRVALVDAQRPYLLGSEQSVVLGKSPSRPELGPLTENVVKTVLRLDLSAPVDPERFRIPDRPAVDEGFRALDRDQLVAPPKALPRGFRVVQSGRGPAGDAVLLYRGALPVLIEMTQLSSPDEGPRRTERATVGGRPAILAIPLYGTPSVRLSVAGSDVTISAPLPTASLVELASLLYPPE